jgi:dTDP-4-dehydrorhamnose 3,5-epimerase
VSVPAVEPTPLAGVFVIVAQRVEDERGWFARVYDEAVFAAHGLCTSFPQHGEAHNPRRGTVRGLHFQTDPHAQAKLVRCERGALYDVVVDLRPESPTYGAWYGLELRAEAPRALYVPAGFAHGYQTLEDATDVHYLTSSPYVAAASGGIAYDSPALAIPWPVGDAIVAPKDAALPVFERRR